MASWRSYLGGRYSPFTSNAPRSPPQVTESDYHYIGPDDIVDPPREYRGPPSDYDSGRRGAPVDDASQPDILILRHRGTTYPLHFPAYMIGEGILRVGEVRRYAAKQTGTDDPRRIKLIYKGKALKDDAVACREEGLKQNSELMCVVSETPNVRGSSSDTDSASDSDFRAAGRSERAQSMAGLPGSRVAIDGHVIDDPPRGKRKKDRNGRGAKAKGRDDEPSGADGYLRPAAHEVKPASRPTTPATTTATTTAAPPPPPQATNPPSTSAPKTARDQLAVIAETFRTKWVPLCEAFVSRPPTDSKARFQEYTKLSESILAQIIFKLDGVEIEGDSDARATRKAIIQETQSWLSRLDAVGKPGSKSPT